MKEVNKDNAAHKPLRLFVYGTLKWGYWNHDRFCNGALYIEQASVRGQLYRTPSGIPVLKVPDSDILAVGTKDPLVDFETQERFSEKPIVETACDATDWRMIQGELVIFPDPQLSLPPIDKLEGFQPGSPSLYRRVLVPIITKDDEQVAAWCYVCGENMAQRIAPMNKTCWP